MLNPHLLRTLGKAAIPLLMPYAIKGIAKLFRKAKPFRKKDAPSNAVHVVGVNIAGDHPKPAVVVPLPPDATPDAIKDAIKIAKADDDTEGRVVLVLPAGLALSPEELAKVSIGVVAAKADDADKANFDDSWNLQPATDNTMPVKGEHLATIANLVSGVVIAALKTYEFKLALDMDDFLEDY